ncbi:predicted protein [Lichtheimia corymbifera JMRC:FSU:9682]|uniref:Ricin B lectin domain-containing protein n=1 Tax=Lichtheimia corymbifera JMRC:FSU:9682 TaxID=1263082 RepID=A0A068RND4_9FUNG|nr:predicted protein [Lichtheimia corymbifera JMRC:FSU:9682]
MPRHSFSISYYFVLVVAIMAALTSAQGVSDTGEKDGNAIYDAAKTLSPGNYVFKSATSKQYLSFISEGNLVVPKSSHHPRVWEIRKHEEKNKATKYWTARGQNKAGNEKCISTRWTVGDGQGGYPDAAVLWQCETDTKKHDTGGYDPIVTEKQLWLAVPDPKHDGYFKIISASHLFDMIPTCIDSKTISGGTKLTKCKVDTDKKSLLWKITKVD